MTDDPSEPSGLFGVVLSAAIVIAIVFFVFVSNRGPSQPSRPPPTAAGTKA